MLDKIQDLLAREKTVIIEGGAGFYLKMLLTHSAADLDQDGELTRLTDEVDLLGNDI